MNWWQAVILGLVEGITEYLPISSTGHLILAQSFLGLNGDGEKSAVDAYLIVIQGGAILAVLGLYRVRVLSMIKGLLGRDPDGRRLLVNLIVAFLPAAVLGVLLDDLIEAHLFSPVPVLAALAGGGVLMIVLRPRPKEVELTDLAWRAALIIGLMQCVAMWPGTSRSMMTIVGGMLIGLRPRQAAEFSFLLGLPTLGGACVYKLAGNLNGDGATMFEVLGLMPLVIGFAVATVSAALAVKWLVEYLNRHGLAVFGWYRIALAAVLGALIAADVVEL
ncbi:MAG: undecaprenyl-diphosphate phosphatase [Planctomycetota bacterium]